MKEGGSGMTPPPDLLAQAMAVTKDFEEVSARLVQAYAVFCQTVRTNGLARGRGGLFRDTTFDVPNNTVDLTWRPDSTDAQDLCFITPADGHFYMPQAWLQDPQAWLQGALAAHGQAVADDAASAALVRQGRIDKLRRELEVLEAQG